MFHGVQLSSLSNNCCRVCLKTVNESRTFLDEKSNMLQLFEFSTDIIIQPHDKGRIVCSKCAHKIKSCAKFKKKCIEANEVWQTFNVKDMECSEVKTEDVDDEDEYHDSCDSYDMVDNSCFKETSLINMKYESIDVSHKPKTDMRNVRFRNAKVIKNINKVKKLTRPKDINKPKVPIQKSVINYCGLCDYLPLNSDDNREHLTEHWLNNNLKCNLCGFTSQDSADLMTHRYTHYPNKNIKFYACHVCEKKCASILSLEFHYRSVHLQKPGGYCGQCRKSFNVYSTWNKHCRLHNIERFICDHCGRKFLYRNQIEEHLRDLGDTRNFICEACGKGFKRKFGLKTHVEAVHSSETIKCTHCDKVFKSQITYKDHMKVVKAEKPFRCVQCGKTYHLESALRSHMFWHSGERPHICEVCGLKYKSKGQLKVHTRNHTGYMPFKCKECDKCFTSSQPLKRHQSVHTGKRAHKCSHCERTFHERKMLLEHCASSHKEKLDVKLENT